MTTTLRSAKPDRDQHRRWVSLVRHLSDPGWKILFLLVVSLVVAPQLLVVAAQEPLPPIPTPVGVEGADSEAQLDLAALTIRPSDLAALGLHGFGLANQSSLRDALNDALVQAREDEVEAARRFTAYRETGYRYRYVSSLLQPTLPLNRIRSGAVPADWRIFSAVAEYASPEGASASFAYMEGGLDHVGGEDVADARAFGNESDITRSRGREVDSNEPFRRLELSFRVDNLIAEVAMIHYETVEPDLVVLEQLGEILLARIEQARTDPGPRISPRVLRIEPVAPQVQRGIVRDFYIRIDGQGESTFAEIVNRVEAGLNLTEASVAPEPAETVRAIDTYMYWTQIGFGDQHDLPLYVSWIDRYLSPQQANVAVNAVTTDLGPGYVDVRELFTIVEPVGDGVRAFAYRYEGDPELPVQGHLVIARIGEYVIRVQADAPNGVRREGVMAMALRQAECLQADAACPSVLVDQAEAELLPGRVVPPAATPVANA
jgi:hypothetical protein